MIAQLRTALTGRFRMLEREAAKTALDLNAASAELHDLSVQVAERENEHTALQEVAYANEAELTEARRQLGEIRLDHERMRGKLDYQAKQIGDHRTAAGAGRGRDARSRNQTCAIRQGFRKPSASVE